MKYIARWTVAHDAIIDAKDADTALEKFIDGEYTDETEEMMEYEVVDAVICGINGRRCGICGKHEDDDGRCGCTNKDAR